MGMTFGGENGFKKSPKAAATKGLDIIYEQEQKKEGDFKENMLLSFYNWPKIETSSVLGANNRNTSRNRRDEKRTSTLKIKKDLPQ